jgi:hypothetical protein
VADLDRLQDAVLGDRGGELVEAGEVDPDVRADGDELDGQRVDPVRGRDVVEDFARNDASAFTCPRPP